jgi:hypothetical protein
LFPPHKDKPDGCGNNTHMDCGIGLGSKRTNDLVSAGKDGAGSGRGVISAFTVLSERAEKCGQLVPLDS